MLLWQGTLQFFQTVISPFHLPMAGSKSVRKNSLQGKVEMGPSWAADRKTGLKGAKTVIWAGFPICGPT
jgi:hypothetical protein